MSLTLPGLRRTAREAVVVAKHAGQTPTQLKQRIAELTDDNTTVTEANELLVCELTSAMIRACKDSMRIAQLEAELAAAVAEVKRLQGKTIRSAAEQERLRQMVINARPLITSVTQRLDRPYVSHVQIPYPVPVGRDMSGETTVETPLVDLPEPWPTYTLRPAPAA